MHTRIREGFKAFITDGSESVGTVRAVDEAVITVYVENAGDFQVPVSSIKEIHDGKVLLDAKLLRRDFLSAVDHQHDREDPSLVG
jgi:hypothetical protein